MQFRATVWHVMAAVLAVMFALLVASPSAAATPASTYDTAVYTYDGLALLSPPDSVAKDARGSPPRLGAVSWGRSVSVGHAGVAANTAADVPLIKPGAAGGETAGRVFPQSVRQQALAENPSTCVYCRMETQTPQVDHVIPRSTGGNATLQNAQTTCPWCNASKGAREFPVNPPPGYRGAWPPEWWGVPE